MEHEFLKLTEINDAYKIVLQGGTDEAKFGRVFNKSLKSTHALDFREEIHQDGEVKRNAIIVWMRPLDLKEVRVRSNDFADLSQLELQTLIERNQITMPAIEKGQNRDEQRAAMLKALRGYKPAPATPDATPATKPQLVIPAEVSALDLPNALTKAAMLGVSTKDGKGKQVDLPTLQGRIARKMSEQEKVTA